MGSFRSPDTLEIYRQDYAKPQEVEEAREENRTTGWKTPHHGRGAHHGLTVAATTGRGGHWWWWSVVFRALRFGVVWCFALGRRFCLSLGLLGLFLLSSFDPHGPNFFSLDSSCLLYTSDAADE